MLPNPNLKGAVSINGKPLQQYIKDCVGKQTTPSPDQVNDEQTIIMTTLQEISKANKTIRNEVDKQKAETLALQQKFETLAKDSTAKITALETKLDAVQKQILTTDPSTKDAKDAKDTAAKITTLDKKLEAVQKQLLTLTTDSKPRRGVDAAQLDTAVTQLRKEINKVNDDLQKFSKPKP